MNTTTHVHHTLGRSTDPASGAGFLCNWHPMPSLSHRYLNKATTTRAELRGLNLESMLIKPIQRICKYQLLLRDLLRNMEKTHKNRAQIETALSEVKRTATKVNDKMKDHEATRKVIDIFNTVKDLPNDLVAPGRKFEVEANVKVLHVGSDE